MKYDLSHLIQQSDQNVFGPIQDDEAWSLGRKLDTKRSAHGKYLPFRHGVTIMKKFSKLEL